MLNSIQACWHVAWMRDRLQCMHSFLFFNIKVPLLRSAEVKCSLKVYKQYVFKVSEIKKQSEIVWVTKLLLSQREIWFLSNIAFHNFRLLYSLGLTQSHNGVSAMDNSYLQLKVYQAISIHTALEKYVLILRTHKSFCTVIDIWFLHFKSKVKITVQYAKLMPPM